VGPTKNETSTLWQGEIRQTNDFEYEIKYKNKSVPDYSTLL